MDHGKRLRLLGTFSLLAAMIGSTVFAADNHNNTLQQARALFKPLPENMGTKDYPVIPERVALGKMLFFDPRISLDGTVSCARCHQPSLYGTDGLPKPIGVKDRENPRNAPTVLNAALQFVAHWRGDRKNVEDQATKALIGPPSFGQPDFAAAMARIKAITDYPALFHKAFPDAKDPVKEENWGLAIGAYERTLVTPSPFDAYLKGNDHALSPGAVAGLQKFMAIGCSSCHNGVGIGGGMYQKFGLVENYWLATGSKKIDPGRFDVTKDPSDKYVFKVPSLRNVAMTAPYFHDGSVATLSQAVRIMARVQLGLKLDDRDVRDIISFLDSLRGPLPADFLTVPELPPGPFGMSSQSP